MLSRNQTSRKQMCQARSPAERALASGFQSRWESGKAAITFCVVRTSRSKRVTVRSLVAMAKSSL